MESETEEAVDNLARSDHARPGDQALQRRLGRRGGTEFHRDRRRALRPRRPLRLWQDHHAAHDQPAHRALGRSDPDRRDGRLEDRPRPFAPEHRLRDPTGRALPAPARGGQRRHGAPSPRLGPRPRGRSGEGAARPGRIGSRPVRASVSRTSSRAANASASAWRGPWAGIRPCC